MSHTVYSTVSEQVHDIVLKFNRTDLIKSTYDILHVLFCNVGHDVCIQTPDESLVRQSEALRHMPRADRQKLLSLEETRFSSQ